MFWFIMIKKFVL